MFLMLNFKINCNLIYIFILIMTPLILVYTIMSNILYFFHIRVFATYILKEINFLLKNFKKYGFSSNIIWIRCNRIYFQ
jgi:hypothetical protein